MCEKRLKSGYLPRNVSRFRNHGQTDDRLCRNTFPDQTQPCRQTLSSCNSRQPITRTALENTASISTCSMGSVGSTGWITRLTKKCFCLAAGLTAVHLVKRVWATLERIAPLNSVQVTEGVQVSVSQGDLAQAAMASRQRVNQQLRRFQDQGLIRLGYRSIILLIN